MISQKQDGEDLVFVATSREFGAQPVEAFRLDGNTGAVKVNGHALESALIQQAAYTQTYATAAKTVPAATTHAITDSSTGTASTSTLAAMTGVDGSGSNAAPLTATKNNIATLGAELELAKADILAVKKVVNAIIDDLQALSLVG